MQDHFNDLHDWAKISDHDLESLKAIKIHFESWGKLPKLGFVFAWTTLMAFYHVAYNVTKSNKPHTIAEELIKPCVLQMTKNFMGKDA